MKRVCIGPIQDGKAGGIDRYILNLFENTRDEPIAFDFFTDAVHPELQAYLQERSAGLIPVSSLAHPIRQYREYRALFRSRQYDTVLIFLRRCVSSAHWRQNEAAFLKSSFTAMQPAMMRQARSCALS